MDVVRTAFGVAVLAWIVATLAVQGSEAGLFVAAAMAAVSLGAILVGLPMSMWRHTRLSNREATAPRVPCVLLGLAAAWLVLIVVLSIFSFGGVALPPVAVCGILALGAAAGLFFRAPPSEPWGVAVAWFGGGLVLSWVLASATGFLALFGAMTGLAGSWEAATSAARGASPALWLAGWLSAEAAWRRGRQPLAIGVTVGALELGLLGLGLG